MREKAPPCSLNNEVERDSRVSEHTTKRLSPIYDTPWIIFLRLMSMESSYTQGSSLGIPPNLLAKIEQRCKIANSVYLLKSGHNLLVKTQTVDAHPKHMSRLFHCLTMTLAQATGHGVPKAAQTNSNKHTKFP